MRISEAFRAAQSWAGQSIAEHCGYANPGNVNLVQLQLCIQKEVTQELLQRAVSIDGHGQYASASFHVMIL